MSGLSPNVVIAGLDPAIHVADEPAWTTRVKPGGDEKKEAVEWANARSAVPMCLLQSAWTSLRSVRATSR
jgi:hypothetical protein